MYAWNVAQHCAPLAYSRLSAKTGVPLRSCKFSVKKLCDRNWISIDHGTRKLPWDRYKLLGGPHDLLFDEES
jgi:hypothetical protein